MPKLFRPSHRALQQQYDTTRLADRIESTLFRERLTAEDRAFIERLDMFFLATADAEGRPSCSFKGGDPGFVRVTGEAELVFPCYDGNGMFLSMGNASENPQVGMLFIDFETPHRIRVHGEASIDRSDPLLQAFQEAELVVRVKVAEIFINCPRYIHPYRRVATSKYAPQTGCETPGPQWKRIDALQDALPARDKGIAEMLGGTLTPEEYGAMVMRGEG